MAKKNASVVATVDTAIVDTAIVDTAIVDTATVENVTVENVTVENVENVTVENVENATVENVENATMLELLCSITDVDSEDVAAIKAFEKETETVKSMLSVANLSEDMQKTLLSGVIAKSKSLYADYIGDVLSNGFSFSVGTLLSAQTFVTSFDKTAITEWAENINNDDFPIEKLQAISEYVRYKCFLSKVTSKEYTLLSKIQKIMANFGFTMADFDVSANNHKTGDSATAKVAAKFFNPHDHGKTWSGRGRQPIWFAENLKNGITADDMLISKK